MRVSILWVISVVHFLDLNCLGEAQESASDFWQVPNGKQGDFTYTFTQGTVETLTWDAWTTTDIINGYESLCEMGIRSYEGTFDLNAAGINPLTTHVNITAAGYFNWPINMPLAALDASVKYTVWFQPEDSQLGDSSGDALESPFFLIKYGSLSSSASTGTSTGVSSGTSTGTSTPTSTNTTPPKQNSQGLSSGAKGGIGAAAALVGLAIIGAAAFFLLRKRSNRKSEIAPPEYDIVGSLKTGQYNENTGHAQELHAVASPSELHNESPAELYGGS